MRGSRASKSYFFESYLVSYGKFTIFQIIILPEKQIYPWNPALGLLLEFPDLFLIPVSKQYPLFLISDFTSIFKINFFTKFNHFY